MKKKMEYKRQDCGAENTALIFSNNLAGVPPVVQHSRIQLRILKHDTA